jgi:hypothetical protein
MASKPDDYKKPTNIVQIASLIALVALTFIDSQTEDFTVSLVVYGIIGGLLLGVTNVLKIFK